MRRPLQRWLLAATLAVGCTLKNPDPMRAQHKEHAYGEERFFADGRSMRVPVVDTVPQERGLAQDMLPVGGWDGGFVVQNPLPLTAAVLDEGEQAFSIYCATCHGPLADGDTQVARNMSLRPPPPLIGKLPPNAREPVSAAGSALPHPRGFYVTVMTDGYGLMPQYGSALTAHQRWAIVAYLELLARSQNVPLASLPPSLQQQLQEEKGP